MIKQETRNSLSLLLLRLGLGAVFILFGYDKLPHPENWIIYYSPKIHQLFPVSPYIFLKFQAVVEVLLGVALAMGFLTRINASIIAVILGMIIFFLWPDPVTVRDLGLFCASLALVLSGPGPWSLDAFLEAAR